jgi:hypothetical protein
MEFVCSVHESIGGHVICHCVGQHPYRFLGFKKFNTVKNYFEMAR